MSTVVTNVSWYVLCFGVQGLVRMRVVMTGMTLVLGVGNPLMGDEGVGIHAVRTLERESWPEEVIFLEGDGSAQLLGYLHDFSRIVMIDATLDGQAPGTVTVLKPEYASDFPRSLTAHDVGLRDVLESAVSLGPLPDITLITVSIDRIRPMDEGLSTAVAGAVAEIRSAIHEIVDVHAAEALLV